MIHREDYATVQKLLHWLVVILVIGMIAGGQVMTELGWPDPETAETTNFLYMMHKSTGFLLLAVMLLRVLARIVYGAPLQDPLMPAIQRFVAGATHFLLYALLIAMPLVGWIATSAGNYLEPVYGLFSMPSLTPALICETAASVTGPGLCADFLSQTGADQAKALFGLHEIIAKAIVALSVLHVLGALYHIILKGDGVFERMWFRAPHPEKLK